VISPDDAAGLFRLVSGAHEPSADARLAAANLFELYTALVQQGFRDDQAVMLLGMAVAGRPASG
jgi:hypothetical protein